MSGRIGEELQLLAVSVYAGLVFALCYDVIRIFRRVFPASMIRSIIEDVLFWTAAAVYLFQLFLRYNYGSPRYYGIGATALTMLLYERLVGRKVVGPLSDWLRRFFRMMLKPLKKIRNGFKLIYKKLFRKNRKILRNKRKEYIDDVRRPVKKRIFRKFRKQKEKSTASKQREKSAASKQEKGYADQKA